MSWKKKSLSTSKVYLILDTEVADYDRLLQVSQEVVGSGVDIVQLRDKKGSAEDILAFSKKIKKIVKDKALYIINDRVDLALASGADGVHLGQDDMPILQARAVLGQEALIGLSAQTLAAALQAQSEGADYIGFGSVFKTKTKPRRTDMDLDLLEKVVPSLTIPVFAIGGITVKNVAMILNRGVSTIAVCRAILEDPQPSDVAKSFRAILHSKDCGRSSMVEPQLPKLVT